MNMNTTLSGIGERGPRGTQAGGRRDGRSNGGTPQGDPLAHAAEMPDVAALIEEFTYAMQNGPAHANDIALAEDTRLNRWPGKSPERDGCLWQKNQQKDRMVRPYDGRPDTDVNLADELVASLVDVDMAAFEMAQLSADTNHVSTLTAGQVAELTAVGRWVRKATMRDTRDGAELLSQIKNTLGWCVLNPGWFERYGTVKRTVTMDDLIKLAADAPPRSAESQLPVLVLNPEMEDAAVELARGEFPWMKTAQIRTLVRELRDSGATEFMDRQLEERRPTIKVLIPGFNFFVSGGTGDLQRARGTLRIEFFYQAELEAMAVDAGWNEEFIAEAINTAGLVSAFGDQIKTMTKLNEAYERRIEIWTTEVRQLDEETGTTGIYCTTFSPHLKPEGTQGTKTTEGTKGEGSDLERCYYAAHYLLDYAHGQYPYVTARMEVIGPALDDSRGVPEMVRSDVKVIKKHQDALAIRAELETNPPRIKTGTGWSKVKDEFGPGADYQLPPGAQSSYLELPKGNPQISQAVIERIEKGSRRRFSLPNNGEDGSHPSLWQMRQMRNSKRWLGCWEDAFWQLTVLCYQNFDAYELGQIIGRWPQLTVEELLRHRITLTFDARALDHDWVATVLEFVTKMMTWDKGGLIDTAPLIRIGFSYIDPTIIGEVLKKPAGAQAQLYRQVEQDISSMMDFNPPQLREGDASAWMQLQMAFAVIGKNPMYQQKLQQVPQIQEALKTYLENLQHNVQETTISPVQGRLGVSEMPQTPIQSGPRQLANGNY